MGRSAGREEGIGPWAGWRPGGRLWRLEDAGAAAVVLPSLFQEQLALEADQVGRLLEAGAGSLSTALSLDD